MTALAPPVPPAVAPQVALYLGLAAASEGCLGEALLLVAERHEQDPEVAHTATILAGWCARHLGWLRDLEARYGTQPNEHPQRLRAVLLSGDRTGGKGLLDDLRDLTIICVETEMTWSAVVQGAKELADAQLQEVAADAREHTRRTMRWLRTQALLNAPEVLSVAPDKPSELVASLPKRIDRVAALPDLAWGPLAAGLSVAVVALASLIAAQVFLFPSLGPTAALVVAEPAAPTVRAWNILAGHAAGFAVALVALALLGAASDPTVFADHVLTPGRAAASVLAVALTVLAGLLVHAEHPPASATTLLVTLGGIATLQAALGLGIGVILIALVAVLLRRLRLERPAPAERLAPRGGLTSRWLKGGDLQGDDSRA
jgi:hypothetical protein